MNLGSSEQISSNAVAAVGKSLSVPTKSAPGYFKAYEAVYQEKQQQNKEKNQDKTVHRPDQRKVTQESSTPEIFKLLEQYRFKDFFELTINGDESKLKLIINQSRKSRGVCNTLPVSQQYRKSNDFINRMDNLYSNANWLMQAKPGKLYSGVL